ncbi:MAG: hypothetical protein IJL53_04505 [Firmicutes bacterium]|nr:hypothetical protein [Bacillota bacterium]
MANISTQKQDQRECIIVEKTGEWIAYQADMILRLQPEGLLTAYSADTSRWIGYIRPEGASLADLVQMPDACDIISNLQKIYETAEKLLLNSGGFPIDPELWFYTEGKLTCIYIPEAGKGAETEKTDKEIRLDAETQNQKEKIAYMFLLCAVQKKCLEAEMNAYYRYYLEAAGILTAGRSVPGIRSGEAETAEKEPVKYSLSEMWSANPYIADISPAELSTEGLPDLLGGEGEDAEKGKVRYSLFRRREKKRK